MDDFIYVSLVVTNNSSTIKNELLRFETPLDPDQAFAYLAALEEWMKNVPVPGHLKEPVIEPPIDAADRFVVRLPQILSKRDPSLFGPYDVDAEAELSVVEDRPYDRDKLENHGARND